MKVKFLDKNLLKNISSYLIVVVGFTSGLLTFVDLTAKERFFIFKILIIGLIFVYFILLIIANRKTKITLEHDGSTIEIKQGDILSDDYKKENIIRVFNFNEFFDTKIDQELVSAKTLNGQILNKEFRDEITTLDKKIDESDHLSRNILEKDVQRIKGKTTRYSLGTIFSANKNTFFTALTHFDEENKARLLMPDYIKFLMKFWDEIDNLYDGNTVVITLFGNGRTRLDNGTKYEPQELLKIILWTFKLRKLKFEMPDKLVILLDSRTNSQIDYFHLKEDFNGL
ncbi:hypothetical protein WOSG25_061480 [Weissella oryzae SG25]|uniref:Thoeris protein ThsA Macro domain-containing protein n=1 Tax=Weissella oryzae (strain DSM 25784 / JCM 18191 / LMG 30913 / SG25) TaxID=1329250 RepID=A0A069CUV5_WEIOS|nr:macro domain-containing protein [Weissella oryzae]GAK31018.1 hypothetical protein WOSG25_061480 [Weissella oryzae SG25]